MSGESAWIFIFSIVSGYMAARFGFTFVFVALAVAVVVLVVGLKFIGRKA